MTKVQRTSLTLLFSIVALLALWLGFSPNFSYNRPQPKYATLINATKAISAFDLVTTNNTTFNEKSLKGHWTLMFFGYATCPDVCPATLSIVKQAWENFPNNNVPAKFVFTTINPNPDSKETLKSFLNRFNSDFIGLTGSASEINKLSKELKVFAEPDGNEIAHTAALMLVDPKGQLKAIFTPPVTAEQLINDLNILAG